VKTVGFFDRTIGPLVRLHGKVELESAALVRLNIASVKNRRGIVLLFGPFVHLVDVVERLIGCLVRTIHEDASKEAAFPPLRLRQPRSVLDRAVLPRPRQLALP
jgi:hypothetical protein